MVIKRISKVIPKMVRTRARMTRISIMHSLWYLVYQMLTPIVLEKRQKLLKGVEDKQSINQQRPLLGGGRGLISRSTEN